MECNADAKKAVFKLLAESEKAETYQITPNVNLLERIHDFLPAIARDNERLSGIPQLERDIEQVKEGMRHIEMDVGLFECPSDAEYEDDMNDDSDSSDSIVLIRSPPPSPGRRTISDKITDMDTAPR